MHPVYYVDNITYCPQCCTASKTVVYIWFNSFCHEWYAGKTERHITGFVPFFMREHEANWYWYSANVPGPIKMHVYMKYSNHGTWIRSFHHKYLTTIFNWYIFLIFYISKDCEILEINSENIYQLWGLLNFITILGLLKVR